MKTAEPIDVPGKYLSITSYRRDGTPVATPVWFVREGDHLLVETDAESHKIRRIRGNPAVSVAPCTASGKLRGEPMDARAEVLGPEALEAERRLMGRKYRVDRILVLPIYHAVQKLRGKPGVGKHPVVLSITPEEER